MVHTLGYISTPGELQFTEHIIRLSQKPFGVFLPAIIITSLLGGPSLAVILPYYLLAVFFASSTSYKLATPWLGAWSEWLFWQLYQLHNEFHSTKNALLYYHLPIMVAYLCNENILFVALVHLNQKRRMV